MPDAFDAYYEWLGIPPREQPPTAYRLLGIDQGEANPHVIQNAAERQTTYVRSRQLGPRQQAAQALLNEISAARVLLLDPRRKAEYDATLAAQQGVVPPPMVTAAPPLVAPSKLELPRVLRAEPGGAATAWLAQPLVWGLAVAGMAFLAGGTWVVMQSRGTAGSSVERPPATAPPSSAEADPAAGDGDKPVRTGRPPKKPRKGKKLDPTLDEPIESTEPAAPPAKPPKKTAAEKELEGGLADLADSLLDKMTRPGETPAPAPTSPITPPEPAPPKGKPAKRKLPPAAERMAYVVEPMPGRLHVTIHDTPFGTATVLLEGDFTDGTTHKLTRSVTPPAGVETHGRGEAEIEVEVVDGKVARVAWDGHDVPRRK